MQRFDTTEWNSVRYAEAQKKYVAFPAFSELKVNDELRRFEDHSSLIRWVQNERNFAALSNAFLTRNEAINRSLQNFIDWSAKPDTSLSAVLFLNYLEFFGNRVVS